MEEKKGFGYIVEELKKGQEELMASMNKYNKYTKNELLKDLIYEIQDTARIVPGHNPIDEYVFRIKEIMEVK